MKKKKWILADIPSQQDKISVITGANSGLGFESSKALSSSGATVIMACRSVEKGNVAKQLIKNTFPDAQLDVMHLDLMSLDSVRAFSRKYIEKYNRLDILINNAGIMMSPFQLTHEGFESQFGTNHLGHFALTGLLIDLIKSTPGARVVTISSMAHKRANFKIDELINGKKNEYSSFKAYQKSKLANLLFTYELQRFFEQNAFEAKALAAHPGFALTNIMRYMGNEIFIKILKKYLSWLIPSSQMGALPLIRAAVDPKVNGGDYFGPGGLFEMRGFPVLVKSSAISYDTNLARQLWEASENMTGINYRSS